MLLFFAPYPVPMPGPTEELEGYVLVSYGDGGHIAADDTLSVSLERFLRDRAAAPPAPACTLLVACEQACCFHAPAVKHCGVCWSRVEVGDAPQLAMYAMGTAKEAPVVRSPQPFRVPASVAIHRATAGRRGQA